MKTLLIAGNNTDVGKTVLITSLVAYKNQFAQHQTLGLMKLIQTGVGDQELYHQLFGSQTNLEIVTPLSYAHPCAPPIAAGLEGKTVDLASVWKSLQHLQATKDFVLVEGIGGLGTPVTPELTVADLARDWHLPTVLVVNVALGAISQTVANVAYARYAKVPLIGIVLSCSSPHSESNLPQWAPVDLLQSITNSPILGIIPYLKELHNLQKLAHIAKELPLTELFLI